MDKNSILRNYRLLLRSGNSTITQTRNNLREELMFEQRDCDPRSNPDASSALVCGLK